MMPLPGLEASVRTLQLALQGQRIAIGGQRHGFHVQAGLCMPARSRLKETLRSEAYGCLGTAANEIQLPESSMRSTWIMARPQTAKWPKAVFGTGEMWGFVGGVRGS
jgi:hypothetical protein